MAAAAAKNDCNFNEFVRIISGSNNILSISNINFAPKINMFHSLVIDCMNAENEIEFYLPREEINGRFTFKNYKIIQRIK